jgi:hypothetical protein
MTGNFHSEVILSTRSCLCTKHAEVLATPDASEGSRIQISLVAKSRCVKRFPITIIKYNFGVKRFVNNTEKYFHSLALSTFPSG